MLYSPLKIDGTSLFLLILAQMTASGVQVNGDSAVHASHVNYHQLEIHVHVGWVALVFDDVPCVHISDS